jgi:hypothetical protein
MGIQDAIRLSQTCAADARRAVREFHAAVMQPQPALVIFFCSGGYDLDVLAEELRSLFGDVPLVGCTTAGEIGPAGYRHGICGASFASHHFTVVSGLLDGLQDFSLGKGSAFVQSLLQRLEGRAPSATDENTFAFQLIDGLSVREEPVTRTLKHALGGIPLFGGSAGDDLKFAKTHVYAGGRFHSDSAVLVLASTDLPFRIFKTQHFVPTDERLVVTEADSASRTVMEINGLPAAQEYARLVGVGVDELDPLRFAASPVVVVIDGTDYVRSIQKANADGSLTFYCAIEEGLVLRVARGVDLLDTLEQTFSRIRAETGPPQAAFVCDCVLRMLEITQYGLQCRVEEVFRRNNVIGFNSYGEQFHGVHVNQTLTGIAFGAHPVQRDG